MPLPQPLHIFRKDAVHLWPETLVVLVLFGAFAWSAPSGWTQSPYAGVAQLLAGLLHILMPLSWLVLIARLVHDEPLVGDRQFWTSRPYHWAKLLAAKLLFLLLFLYLPFFLMQVYLLKHAGLHPTSVIPALLYNLVLLTVVLVVPMLAIAAVTGTFPRMLLSVLGGLLYVGVIGGTVGFILFSKLPPLHLGTVLTTVVIVLPLVALLFQYATRRTLTSRLMLVATPLIVALFVLITPLAALIRNAYPVLPETTGSPRLSAIPDELRPRQTPLGALQTFRNNVDVAFPFTVAGVDKDSNYIIDGVSATIDAAGTHWTSPYLRSGREINAGSPLGSVSVPMPVDLFNKIHDLPAEVHLSLATEHLKIDPPSTWKSTLLPFSVPGNGLCSYSSEAPDRPPLCRYPFKTPEVNYVTAPLAPRSCSAPPALRQPGARLLEGASGNTLDFDPVVTVPLALRTRDPDPQHLYVLCPGTELSFIQATHLGRGRLEVEEKQLILDPFAARIAPQATEGDAPTGPPPGLSTGPTQ